MAGERTAPRGKEKTLVQEKEIESGGICTVCVDQGLRGVEGISAPSPTSSTTRNVTLEGCYYCIFICPVQLPPKEKKKNNNNEDTGKKK